MFSLKVLPRRPAIHSLMVDLQMRRNNGVTTGLYTLAQEREHNPFMLVNDPEVQSVAKTTDPIETMAFLRHAKNRGYVRA